MLTSFVRHRAGKQAQLCNFLDKLSMVQHGNFRHVSHDGILGPTPVPQRPTPVPQRPTPVPQRPTPVPQRPSLTRPGPKARDGVEERAPAPPIVFRPSLSRWGEMERPTRATPGGGALTEATRWTGRSEADVL
jgi:hypothetical protein